MGGAEKSFEKKTKYLLLVLIINFFLLLLAIYVSLLRDILIDDELFLLPFVLFCFLGFLLVYWVRTGKVEGELKKNLNLTGYSAGLIFVSVVLHNLTSGIGMVLLNKDFEEPLFFLLATIVLPLLFVVGSLKSIQEFRRLH
ncbi:hypothetical protein A2715_01365 [Candidatus Woesebacteria bacterium RIFCSPHIGHO2_01_FULL_39_32]|uniref:Uncharacterized protein n=1 Tax=Candidatus Woesebacteria bacterium RIFCSPLOWO2_01_FULL_39_25 TaxID=1802521 RepID=A0A1F8BPW8_9BACT|nr:MAG: hypothetical protein A2124_05680 [Candidatus Woesebacteria bacterium GWB1_37_5]OGM24391.1 MAG: hypothetical protein A2715_01365 [Candidatus Woesebacteria bacterium RIFCSPHIGHO2_01_FULL_39_32]OGM37298.1 MAG: hypothetical protein A3F01_01195 [Candidatus Woesebacteria bacterium RIFCSPHIGHO2_12_FULL_38_11]OGM65415.1 MAG: hypothetical protein A2893_01725 [Candidatus Woesebacteria bacterium RIFCSPLOWO2_01_FULL_39_25]